MARAEERPRRVLVVDDDAAQTAAVVRALTAAGYAVSRRADGIDGLLAVEAEQPALVVLDWALPFIDGPIFTHALRTGMPAPPPVIALVGADADATAVCAAGAFACVPVPVVPTMLVRVVREALDAGDVVSQIAAAAWAASLDASAGGAAAATMPSRGCRPRSRRGDRTGHGLLSPAEMQPAFAALAGRPERRWGMRTILESLSGRRTLLVQLFAAQMALFLRMIAEAHSIEVPYQENLLGILGGVPVLAAVLAVARAVRVRP